MSDDDFELITTTGLGYVEKPTEDASTRVVREVELMRMPLAPNEVQVEVTHCGLCASDAHMLADDWGQSFYPLVAGHEAVGVIRKRGSEVNDLQVGDRVGVGFNAGSCGSCGQCARGHEQLCADVQSVVGMGGCFSGLVHVSRRFVYRLPEALESSAAAPLMCAGLTAFTPLRAHCRAGERVGVVGVGGVGHLVVMMARAFGCHVTAFTRHESKRDDLSKLGAHRVVATDAEFEALRNDTAASLDALLVCSSAAVDYDRYLSTLRAGGRMILVGMPSAEKLTISLLPFMQRQLQLHSTVMGGCVDCREMLDFCALHNIRPLVQELPFTAAGLEEALATMHAGKARYRIVLVRNDTPVVEGE
mmetsp:Transcript_14084/g.35985  ORF Transcript_14084/g.35985 Transcript_14084/m.35985 type:complete len:361 (+) Transcript_14084:293-1375(+)|eukprot:CAMPEP_0174236518 /NCGR_PEP_ID=MMETSP0417-20130205/5632_1 /TAXON_ID=242541 /ORGANISM="Mayorella sp, Strain BSH-02190019" /LENGTH=360 /DNA_ID=CAMNT_0015315179 /DNA_START=301 /DNA_END=1383 /DNA_ORIENTATION=+